MKKIKWALSLGLLAVLAVCMAGGSLAYFLDNEADTKSYAVGSVDISLRTAADAAAAEALTPGAGKAMEAALGYAVDQLAVTNHGKSADYVRFKVCIPKALAESEQFSWTSSPADDWSWNDLDGAPITGTAAVEGKEYVVYTAYYALPLAKDASAPLLSMGYYLKTGTTNQQLAQLIDAGGLAGTYTGSGDAIAITDGAAQFSVRYYAEAVQAAGFSDVHSAFAAFEDNDKTIAQCEALPAY